MATTRKGNIVTFIDVRTRETRRRYQWWCLAVLAGLAALGSMAAPTTAAATEVVGTKVSAPADLSEFGCDGDHTVANSHVKVCFKPSGDKVYVKDGSADGRSGMAELNVMSTGRNTVCRNKHGAGSWAYCDFNFIEHRAVSFRGYTLDHEGLINVEHDHTAWTTECSGEGCKSGIPANYEYDPDRGPLHDYCTSSPDTHNINGTVVDFRGSCARHDMCYAGDAPKEECDDAFWVNLTNRCSFTFPDASPGINRSVCRDRAVVYHLFVIEFGDA